MLASAHLTGDAVPQLSMQTPIGPLTISEENDGIVAVDWGWGRDQTPNDLLVVARAQINAYLDGERSRFDLPLNPPGTSYRQKVWQALLEIPFGETASYGVLAREVGGSARSVGQANRHNPIPILIPCHRVVGASGPGGYSGGAGLPVKNWLLDHERHVSMHLR